MATGRPLISHIVNVFAAPSGSQHILAQAVTLASIQAARDQAAKTGVDVEAVAVCYEEDRDIVEPPFLPAILPDRSILDFGTFAKPRRYPLLGDIVRAGAAVGTGQYAIYSNIDIGLKPDFYIRLSQMLRSIGGDQQAMVINRRTISGRYKSVDELPEIYADDGLKHPGYDCWVFPRSWADQLQLGNVCVGHFWFDMLLLANLDLLSGYRMIVYKNQRMTFHIGDDVIWNQTSDYSEHNRREVQKTIAEIRQKTGRRTYGTWLDWVEHKANGDKTKVRRLMLEARRALQLTKIALLRQKTWS